MYFSVTASMKDLFSPITVSLFSVILQCFIIYVFWVLYSWLLRCDCCQNWQMCFFYTNKLYTQRNQSYPKMCFLLLTALCKSCFSFLYFLILQLFWTLKKKSWLRIVTILSCLSIFFFLYLVAIKDFLIFEMFQCCCVWCLFPLFRPLPL